MNRNEHVLKATKRFWDQSPCDGHSDIYKRMVFRYTKDTFLIPLLNRIAKYPRVLEIGCGQGTDAIYISRLEANGRFYVGIDLSEKSVQSAISSFGGDKSESSSPLHFLVGNSELLPFPDNFFDCIYSGGVLHHTADIGRAIEEVYRVLKPGGNIYITLYRTRSPKIITARVIRAFADVIETIFQRPKFFYNKFGQLGAEGFWGTMIKECLGVPVLNSYGKREVKVLFSNFTNLQIKAVSTGFPLISINKHLDKTNNVLGYQWLIEGKKPNE